MQHLKVRELLQQRRHELEMRSARIGSDLRHDAAPIEGGFADQAAARANEDVLEAIRAAARIELQKIDEALRRLDLGTYGRCEVCAGTIAQERLDAVPYVTACAGCST